MENKDFMKRMIALYEPIIEMQLGEEIFRAEDDVVKLVQFCARTFSRTNRAVTEGIKLTTDNMRMFDNRERFEEFRSTIARTELKYSIFVQRISGVDYFICFKQA